MRLKVVWSRHFKRDYGLAERRGYNMSLLDDVITKLQTGDKLSREYDDHALQGRYRGFRECHVRPDWLLVYRIDKDDGELYLILFRTGTRSDIFGS